MVLVSHEHQRLSLVTGPHVVSSGGGGGVLLARTIAGGLGTRLMTVGLVVARKRLRVLPNLGEVLSLLGLSRWVEICDVEAGYRGVAGCAGNDRHDGRGPRSRG